MLLHPWLSFFWVKYPAEADDIIEPKPDIFSRTTAGTAKKYRTLALAGSSGAKRGGL